jgi:hypothetical protein
MFSDGSITSGSTGLIVGDVYSNHDLNFDNAQTVTGNVVAQGSITTGANVTITGNVTVGGNAAFSSSSSTVNGNVVAGGTGTVGGHVYGNFQAGGAISGCTPAGAHVSGTCAPNSPPPPVPTQTLPTFTWNPANYSPAPTTWATPSAFLTWARAQTSVSGVHYVNVTAAEPTLAMSVADAFKLGGDLTIVVPGSMTINKEPSLVAGVTKAQFSLISTSASGTITIQSSFKPASAISVLLYAANGVDLGNASNFSGAVYARSINALANDTIRYVPLNAVGFSGGGVLPPASSSIRNVSIREVSAS